MKIDFISKSNKVQELYPIVEEGGGELLAPYAVNYDRDNACIVNEDGEMADYNTAELILKCDTKGATIMYQYFTPYDGGEWHIYNGPFVPNYAYNSDHETHIFTIYVKSVKGDQEAQLEGDIVVEMW